MRFLGVGWQRAAVIAAGMILLFAGVVAGSATGTLLRKGAAAPLLLGESNAPKQATTRLTASTTSGALFEVSQSGTGTGIRASSVRGNGAIVSADRSGRYGLLAQNTSGQSGNGAALRAEGGAQTGVQAVSEEGTGLYAKGASSALVADGATALLGDVTLGGACDSCAETLIAVNGSQAVIRSGTALTLTGATLDDAGDPLVTVAAAQTGDRVIGIALTAVVSSVLRPNADLQTVTYRRADSSDALPNETLRIQLSGVVTAARAMMSSGQTDAGDVLTTSATPGILVKATAEQVGSGFAYALGPIASGRVPILIMP